MGAGAGGASLLLFFPKNACSDHYLFGYLGGEKPDVLFSPFVILAIISIANPNSNGLVSLLSLLWIIPLSFLTVFGEELGWRGFLQDSLRQLSEWKRWLLIGLMWEGWHFMRGLVDVPWPAIVIKKLIFIAAVILVTVVIGKLTERTRSLFVATAIHLWINMVLLEGSFNVILTACLSVLIWAYLIWKWEAVPRTKLG